MGAYARDARGAPFWQRESASGRDRDRPGRARDRRHDDRRDSGRDRGNRGHGHGPSGDHAPPGRVRLPNSHCRTGPRHDAAQPNERLHMAGGSSIPNATCSGFLQDTSSPQSK